MKTPTAITTRRSDLEQACRALWRATLALMRTYLQTRGPAQRLALARAWAVRPQLLFLDEPTASLDPAAKRDVEALIQEFAAEGMTVIMSTHNLGQAKRLATRVVYLEAGRLVVDRPVAAFFNEPLPEAAAQFLSGERT